MAILGELDPGEARTPAEYVGLLRRLKEASGLTFRQLEERAAERGDVLARSTLADVLRRDGLPRAEVVAALVRACAVKDAEGAEGAEEQVGRWLAARERLVAVGREAADPTSAPAPVADEAGGSRTRTASLVALASLGTVVLLVVAAVVLLPRDGPAGKSTSGAPRSPMHPAATPVSAGPAPGWSRIRPLRTPTLCLTDGEARARGEVKTVAVQRPCAQAVPPRTYLQRESDGRYVIKWEHPKHGPGCLTVLDEGAFRGMLEPWPWRACQGGSDAQRFRIERAGGGTDRWTIRPVRGTDVCVTLGDGSARAGAVGAAATTRRCTGRDGDGQVFVIGPG